MANICYAPPKSCGQCPHFRFDEDREQKACFMAADNAALIAAAKARIPSLTASDLIDRTIVEIYTDYDGSGERIKYIHYNAYGYYGEDIWDNGKDHRFLEYTWFIVPLQEALNAGVGDFESENGCEYKQYVEDCDEQTMIDRYLHYDNGKCPLPIPVKNLDINIPDGMYILLKEEAAI